MKSYHISYTLLMMTLLSACMTDLIQTPKSTVEEEIRAWQQQYQLGYSIDLPEQETTGIITRYHPENAQEKDHLIRVKWRGMTIILAFKQAIETLEWNPSSFQQAFQFVTVDDIYAMIPVRGWNIHPQTPTSSNTNGVLFNTVENGELSFTIDWEVFTLSGYAESSNCQAALEIADASLPEECYVAINQTIPLTITVEVILKNKY